MKSNMKYLCNFTKSKPEVMEFVESSVRSLSYGHDPFGIGGIFLYAVIKYLEGQAFLYRVRRSIVHSVKGAG
jgi:hypothetical protein